MRPSLYFDHHATTPLAPEVRAAMLPWLGAQFGNAASRSHRWGAAAAEAVGESRLTIAQALHCDPDEIVFTSGATEANNLALKGLLLGTGSEAQLIVSAAEHRAILDPARRLQRAGTMVTVLPVQRDGAVDPDALAAALRPQTRLVSLMTANNEVGTLNDLVAMGHLCRERGVRLHTDAAQAFGHVPLDLRQLPVDLVSVTAHKLYGPQGIGALVVRRSEARLPLTPLLDGGGHEQGLRSGTLPVALIVGFAAAVRCALAQLPMEAARVASLRDQLWARLQQEVPGITRNGSLTHALPHNLNVTIPGVDGDALLMRLQQSELGVSSGAACSSANPEPSHVLRALGRSDVEARASLRFGLGRGNAAGDVDEAATIVGEIVRSLRGAGRA